MLNNSLTLYLFELGGFVVDLGSTEPVRAIVVKVLRAMRTLYTLNIFSIKSRATNYLESRFSLC